jgi:hypothetical protein
MRRLAVAALALVCAGGALAASAPPLTVLAKPTFNAPVKPPAAGKIAFALVSSKSTDPAASQTAQAESFPRAAPSTYGGLGQVRASNGLATYGQDAASARYLVAPGRYAYDFAQYAWPPRIKPGDREFVYEQVVWAKELGGVLYVETAHSTYASSSYGLNGYLNAIDLKTHKLLWRSAALVANANNFVISGDTIVSGYGFTAEPDYLYALDRHTGRVLARLLVPSAPERIARHGTRLTVDTYDHRLIVDLKG